MTLNVYGAFLPSVADREHWRTKVVEAGGPTAGGEVNDGFHSRAARLRIRTSRAILAHVDAATNPRAAFAAVITQLACCLAGGPWAAQA